MTEQPFEVLGSREPETNRTAIAPPAGANERTYTVRAVLQSSDKAPQQFRVLDVERITAPPSKAARPMTDEWKLQNIGGGCARCPRDEDNEFALLERRVLDAVNISLDESRHTESLRRPGYARAWKAAAGRLGW